MPTRAKQKKSKSSSQDSDYGAKMKQALEDRRHKKHRVAKKKKKA
jgi:hypothetical protein